MVSLDEESGVYIYESITDFGVSNIAEKGFKDYKYLSDGDYLSIDVCDDKTGIFIKLGNAKSSYILVQNGIEYDTGAYGSLNNAILAPIITVTESNYYIINGYYTEFEASSQELNPHKNSDNYLVLGGNVTDFKISTNDISVQKGGIVTELSISSKILLLLLCLLAGPLMRIFQYAIPWVKSTLKELTRLMSKY